MGSVQFEDEAFVTLATTDSYAVGALVLAASLRKSNTRRQLVCLITPGVTQVMREQLNGFYNLVQQVDVMDSNDSANLALMARPELGVTFTKIHCWTLTQFKKAVFLDADTLVLDNVDELFDREELSAVSDVGWPDIFNSGLFVFKPSLETYGALLQSAVTDGSWDGGDQGLLNRYFRDWLTADIGRRLPFIYNMTASATYTYLPAFKEFGRNVKIVHFLGARKPWQLTFDTATGQVQHDAGEYASVLIQQWWNVFMADVHPCLSPGLEPGATGDSKTDVTHGLKTLKLSSDTGIGMPANPYKSDREHREAWERGQIQYLGIDAWENIQKHLDQRLAEK